MAGAEKIVERILADARQQADAIKAEAEEKAARIIAQGEQEAEKSRQELLERARATAEERRRRILTIAELEGRKALLAAKEALLEEAFTTALKELQKLDVSTYQGIIRSLLLASIQTGSEEVIISPADQDRLTPAFLEEINQEIKSQGRVGNLALVVEDRPLEGGFILRSGGVDINNSFAAILKMQRDELEPEVAAILFPGEEGGLKEAAPDGK
ncbi:MAG: V-type ATP synthase subunit E [bacterium]|jgi:V/A-type H+-transporting ATPase subunit E